MKSVTAGTEKKPRYSPFYPPAPPPQCQPPKSGLEKTETSGCEQGSRFRGGKDNPAFSGRVIDFSPKQIINNATEPLISYKAFAHGETLRKVDSDIRFRSPNTANKTKSNFLKPNSHTYSDKRDDSGVGKNPKRQKISKMKHKYEKLNAPKLPKSDLERTRFTRRSRTFVVDPHPASEIRHHSWLDAYTKQQLVAAKSTRTERRDGHNVAHVTAPVYNSDTTATMGDKKSTPISKTSLLRMSDTVVHSEIDTSQTGNDPFDSLQESDLYIDREGAKNPLPERGLPTRPKSAGQIQYCDTDDSDDSCLDGVIEIVDIDKELAADPSEPSPYLSVEMHQQRVPSLLAHVSGFQSSPPLPSRLRSSSSEETQHDHHHFHHPKPPKSFQTSRHRHHSGESDLSAFSDSMVKPVTNIHARKRIMSEPEIGNAMDASRKSNQSLESKYEATKSAAQTGSHSQTTASIGHSAGSSSGFAKLSREQMYTDTMERVLSRYSELAVRDNNANRVAKNKNVRNSFHQVLDMAPGKVSTGSGPSLGIGNNVRVIPPRKLKPILKNPLKETNEMLE